MRKTVSTLAIVFVFLAAAFLARVNSASGVAVVEDSWTTVAPLRVTPQLYSPALGAVTVNGKIYFIGNGTNERYDPDTNTWTAITPPPIYHMWGSVAACQNKIYIIGGSTEYPTQVYDPFTDKWENRTSPPETTFGHEANVVNDKIYVISGGKPAFYGIFEFSDANYVYDPAIDLWSKMAPIPAPVSSYSSAVLDNKIYIIGGRTATDVSYVANTTDTVQIFDPEMNHWTIGNPIPTAVYSAGACSTSALIAPKRIYVVGGWKTNLNQVYDPATGSWSLAASIPEVRQSFWLVNINDALYAIGGEKSNSFQATERYIPVGYDESLLPTPSSTASPTSAPDGYAANLPMILSVVVVIVAITIAGLAVYYKRIKKNI